MFIDYIKNRFVEEYEIVNKLVMIDERIQGVKFDINIFNNLNSLNIGIEKDNIFILEGNSKALISLLNQFIGKNNKIIVNRNNLAINKWIIKKYNEFCDISSIDNRFNVIFSNVFNECKGKYIVIGSKSFILEHKSMLTSNVEGIIFE